MPHPEIHPAPQRSTAQLRFPDGSIWEAPSGTPLEYFLRRALPATGAPPMAALVDGTLRDLSFRVVRDGEVVPLTTASSDGQRILQRSLSFLLVVAAKELFPEAEILIDHSLTLAGLYCSVSGRPSFSAEELGRIWSHMQEIMAADEPITKETVSIEDARLRFKASGNEAKARLLSFRQKSHLTIYTLRGLFDSFYGILAPSTGGLGVFALQPYGPGFILRFPRREAPLELPPFHDQPRLAAVFRDYAEWTEVLNVRDVGLLNQASQDHRIREVILVSEALHEERIADIAHQIAVRVPRARLVLVAGPSSSGKTTFSKRLAIQLLAHGVHPFTIAMDDYFVDREKTPRNEFGEFDFEDLGALDRRLLNHQLLSLMRGETVTLPHYNFAAGRRDTGPTVTLSEGHVILAEGIHGLNPGLVPDLPPDSVFRLYVSALTQLNLDAHNRIPTTDTRLLRRIVRDAQTRGYSASDTIAHWENVRRGEELHIFPYQENADVIFNSALVYELSILKQYAEPLLRQVDPGTIQYIEAKRLLSFLQWFLDCDSSMVPDNSLLREFIGGSILDDYLPEWGSVRLGH
jgi:uridine kinase